MNCSRLAGCLIPLQVLGNQSADPISDVETMGDIPTVAEVGMKSLQFQIPVQCFETYIGCLILSFVFIREPIGRDA